MCDQKLYALEDCLCLIILFIYVMNHFTIYLAYPLLMSQVVARVKVLVVIV